MPKIRTSCSILQKLPKFLKVSQHQLIESCRVTCGQGCLLLTVADNVDYADNDSISSSAPSLRRSTRESAAVHANQLCGAFMRSQSRIFAARLESLRSLPAQQNWYLAFKFACYHRYKLSIPL